MIVFSLGATDKLSDDTVFNLEAAHQACGDSDYNIVVFTGGVSNLQDGQKISAGDMMYRWWVKKTIHHGVMVLVEDESATIRENIEMTVKLLNNHHFPLDSCRITVVSERYHLIGIRLWFWLLYRTKVRAIASDCPTTFQQKIRRLLLLPLYLLDPRGGGWLSQRVIKQRSK